MKGANIILSRVSLQVVLRRLTLHWRQSGLVLDLQVFLSKILGRCDVVTLQVPQQLLPLLVLLLQLSCVEHRWLVDYSVHHFDVLLVDSLHLLLLRHVVQTFGSLLTGVRLVAPLHSHTTPLPFRYFKQLIQQNLILFLDANDLL